MTVSAAWLLSGAAHSEGRYEIRHTALPCHDAELNAGAAMFLRQISGTPEDALMEFKVSDRPYAKPYILEAFQYPKVRDDGKSLNDVVQAFTTLALLRCEAQVPDDQLDSNRHDPVTGKRR